MDEFYGLDVNGAYRKVLERNSMLREIQDSLREIAKDQNDQK
jgi:hypothetical protein